MLITNLRIGEQIFIGEDIVLRVVSVKGGKVAISVEAPQSVRVVRGEKRERGCG